MANIDRSKVLKMEVLSVKEYCEKYGGGVSREAIYKAMDNDNIDYVSFGGRERLVVMTDKTRAYVPNESPRRRSTMRLG